MLKKKETNEKEECNKPKKKTYVYVNFRMNYDDVYRKVSVSDIVDRVEGSFSNVTSVNVEVRQDYDYQDNCGGF